MKVLKYTVIKSDKQYDKYTKKLEQLVFTPRKTKAHKDEIALLTLLIESYDEIHFKFQLSDPIVLIKSLMKEHHLKAVDLVTLLNVSAGLVSDILNYKKGLSKETIRILSEKFKMSQEAFNRPYKLNDSVQSKLSNTKIINSRKKLANAS